MGDNYSFSFYFISFIRLASLDFYDIVIRVYGVLLSLTMESFELGL